WKMLNKIFLVISLSSLLLYLFGILTSIINVEENVCKMTYMFEFPQFIKISFPENDKYPKYNLYAYSEGHLTEHARNMYFNGAPVLFIPGNGGSYKQARSLASVALRKGIDNDWIQHLDYFTVDLHGEYSGLFGGVLEEQTQYITYCIKKVLSLYQKLQNPPKSVVLVGHSMGGKIAQALAGRPDVMDSINTIITIAAPMTAPVITFDYYMASYYKSVEKTWESRTEVNPAVGNSTNYCKPYRLVKDLKKNDKENKSHPLDHKLLITIGSGSRDLMVHPGLTNSKYSDVHAMATKIPYVWLSTDHLSSVWCLQLVMTINRFLYSITVPFHSKKQYYKGQSFIEDKAFRLKKAKQFFDVSENKEVQLVNENADIGDWTEDSRRVFTLYFQKGLNRTRYQMIRLIDNPLHTFVKVEAINLDTDDWVFGCSANEISGYKRFCSKAVSLSQYAKTFPSLRHKRIIFVMDLHKMQAKNPKWTHLILRTLPTKDPFKMHIDIHDPSDREISVTMPKWYSYTTEKLLDDTLMGSSLYTLKIKGMDETYQVIELNVKPRSCTKETHHAVAKICVPWTNGFERYHYFTESKTSPMYLHVPVSKPVGYNTTTIPINVDLHLDPTCRYKISIKNSLSMSTARIAQHFSQWIPAHLVAVVFLVLKHQITVTPKDAEHFKCGNFYTAIMKCSPFFIITASRVFVKLVLFFKFLPPPESYEHSLLVSIIIHGTAVAILTISKGIAWGCICFCGNTAHKILCKIIHLPIPTLSSTVVSIIGKFPMSVGIFLISLSLASCGAVGLLLAFLVYFLLLSKMYEDYLEEFVYKTAKLIAEKLFGKQRRRQAENTNNEIRYREQETKQQEEKKKERIEYDSIIEGLSEINFHLSLFFLLLIVTLLNLPTAVTWAKNYPYSPLLKPDPSIYPSCVILVALCVIWQLPTPRDLKWYNYIGNILYVLAVVAVIYCQESVWRLNYLIAFTFALFAIHQVL
ncbi:unnamed protein product, partial [Sphagnum compactum]